ncbi:AsmA family protein [Seongchinamella sediminis]|nr:AsmA family protein [Seongchinamella sediminis]
MRKVIILLILLAVLLLSPLLLMRSERALLYIAHWAVDTFTDLRLELQQPLLRPLKGRVAASEIHLYPKADDGPPFVSVLGFEGDLSAGDIYRGDLAGSRLAARQVTIYVSSRDATADPAPLDWLQYLRWLPDALSVQQLHVVTASEDTLVVPLEDLQGSRTGNKRFVASASARYEGEPLQVGLDLQALFEHEQATGIAVAASFTAPESGSRINLDGELRGTPEDFNYDFKLVADYREVARLLTGLDSHHALAGELTVKALMTGNTDGFSLSNALFILDNMPDYGIEAHGKMDYRFSGENQLLLTIAGEMTTMEAVLQWLDVDLRPLGRAQGSATVSGSLSHPVVEDFILRSENANGLTVNLQGRIDPQRGDSEENQVRLDISAPSLATLEHWIGALPHEPGEFSASGLIVAGSTGLRLEDFIAETGSRETVLLRAEGAAQTGDLSHQQGLAAIESLALKLSVFAPDSEQLGPYLPAGVPAGFAVNGSVSLAGNGEEIFVKEGQITAESSDIVATLLTRSGSLRPLNEQLLNDFAGDLTVHLSDTSALSQFVSKPVPVLGEVRGSGRLIQQQDRFSLENLWLRLDNEEAKLNATGRLADVARLQGFSLRGQFSGVKSRNLLNTTFQDFHYAGELAELGGSFGLERSGNDWSLTEFTVASAGRQSPLQLDARGKLLNFTGTPQGELALDFQLRDPALIEAASGLRTRPSRGSLRLSAGAGTTDASGHLSFDQSDFRFKAQVRHDKGKIDALQLVVDSPSMRLEDVGLQAQKQTEGSYNPAEQLDDIKPGERFQKALQQAPKFNTDIAIRLNEVSGDNTSIDGFNLHFTGAEQRYTLRDFTLGYDQSLTEIRGIIDLNASPPFVSLAVDAVAVPLHTLTRDLGIDFNITGIGNLRGGLAGEGITPEQLVASLDGNLGVALQDAVIDGAAYDVLATDLLSWFYSGAALEESTEVDCTMAQFVLDDGVAFSDSLYIETRRMVATGSARLDLGRHTMDVKFTPRSRSRKLQVPSSIRIRGQFDDPRVTLSPVAAAFDAYAEVLSLVPQIARRIFGGDRRRRTRSPCEPGAV